MLTNFSHLPNWVWLKFFSLLILVMYLKLDLNTLLANFSPRRAPHTAGISQISVQLHQRYRSSESVTKPPARALRRQTLPSLRPPLAVGSPRRAPRVDPVGRWCALSPSSLQDLALLLKPVPLLPDARASRARRPSAISLRWQVLDVEAHGGTRWQVAPLVLVRRAATHGRRCFWREKLMRARLAEGLKWERMRGGEEDPRWASPRGDGDGQPACQRHLRLGGWDNRTTQSFREATMASSVGWGGGGIAKLYAPRRDAGLSN
jgi:hypothetical protein